MVKGLRKYILVLIGLASLSNVALAQVEKGKSRLDIGKKPTKPTTQKQTFVAKPMPKEVKLDKPTAVNQYYRNVLLNGSSKPSVVKTPNAETVVVNLDRSLGSNGENNDKLFSNEKITVSNIYPNPANDFAMIDYSITGNLNNANIAFYNLLSNEIASFELDKSDRKLKVNTSNWDSGVYLYQLIVDGKKVVTKKLLVRHN